VPNERVCILAKGTTQQKIFMHIQFSKISSKMTIKEEKKLSKV